MSFIKNISFFIIIGLLITYVGKYLESDFLFLYLQGNIVGLLLTLLAINTATSGLIASRIQDMLINYPQIDFSGTIRQMKISLIEQLVLIGISVIVLLLMGSAKLNFMPIEDIGNAVLTTVLIYSINILWDTGKAVFVIIEELQKFKNKNNP